MKNWQKITLILLGIIGIHLLLLTQLKFTAWPEMTLWPYLWLHGILPYKDVAIAHTPLLLMKLAVFYKLFGVGILQLKIFTWILIIFTDILIYWVVKKLWNTKTALIAVSVFAFWQMFFDGNGLWFDLLLIPLSVLTFYFVSKKKYFWVGIFWAIMFFTKQTAAFFLLPIGFSLVQSTKWKTDSVSKVQSMMRFIYGGLIVLGIFTLLLVTFKLLPSFYDWAVRFGIFILPKAEGQIQLPDVRTLLMATLPFAIFIPFLINKKTRNLNLLLWAFAGALGAYPRFEYFHFQASLPFLAIASGIVLTGVKNKWTKVFIGIYIFGSIFLFANFFLRNYHEGTRFYEQNVIDVVNYVKENSKPGDKIFVMNWWDNIYALTEDLPATDPWVPQLSWYQGISGIQEKEVTDLKDSKPKLILLQDYVDSGLASYKPQKVYDYVMTNYELKEKVDGIEVLIPKN